MRVEINDFEIRNAVSRWLLDTAGFAVDPSDIALTSYEDVITAAVVLPEITRKIIQED